MTEGSVRVGGVDVRNYGVEALRNQVAVVLQNNVLFSGTILDNLRWGDPEATEEECKHACELACADEFIQKMPKGYHTYIEQGGTNVSGGQKQRLYIARCFAQKPKVLTWMILPVQLTQRRMHRFAALLPRKFRERRSLLLHSVYPVYKIVTALL